MGARPYGGTQPVSLRVGGVTSAVRFGDSRSGMPERAAVALGGQPATQAVRDPGVVGVHEDSPIGFRHPTDHPR